MAEAFANRDREELEQTLLGIWRDVLQAPNLGSEDNLFDHGNRSIAMLKVYLELKTMHDLEVPLAEMFDLTTVSAFVDYACGRATVGDAPTSEDRLDGTKDDALQADSGR